MKINISQSITATADFALQLALKPQTIHHLNSKTPDPNSRTPPLNLGLVTNKECDHTYEALTVDGHGLGAGVAVRAVDDGQLHQLTLLQLIFAVRLLWGVGVLR